MVRINIVIPSEVNDNLRIILGREGYRKGAISEAITEAILDWIKKNQQYSLRSKPGTSSRRRVRGSL